MAQIRLTPIIPQPLNKLAMLRELYEGMEELGQDIRTDFEATVRTWRDKPKFDPVHNKPLQKTDMIYVETSTDQLTYKFVVDGTKPHIITPKRAKMLRFPGTFYPKTIPGLIDSTPGFSGPPIEYRNQVHHPGVEARHFDETIKRKQEANAKQKMEVAMIFASVASRHAYP